METFMSIELKKLTLEDSIKMQKYVNLRPIYVSERQFVNQFIWQEYYDTHFYCNDKFAMCTTGEKKKFFPMMPLCRIEDIPSVFAEIKDYWNLVLQKPLTMYLIDQIFLDTLKTIPGFEDDFEIIEDRDSFDYIYDATKLKTLSGKAYHKKKNHLNSFLKNYDGRYEYHEISCRNMGEIIDFHNRWLLNRDYEDKHNSIRSEENGIHKIIENCSSVNCHIGGVSIDGVLEAYSIGTYAPDIECAFIHIEKANINIAGIYNFINQQFLIHSFPDAKIVNREDDLGQEGLRKAKLSYQPIRLEAKYHLYQRREGML
jgi:hypothetical protein